MPAWLAPAISVLGSGIAGVLGNNAQEEAAELAARESRRNRKLQKEFAQNGIRWRVEDAKRAGLHPLYALGANTASFSPASTAFAPDDSLAHMAANMGQDLSRAVASTRTQDERLESMTSLQLENQSLQNDLLRSQIAKLNSSQTGPALPSAVSPAGFDGQGDAFAVKPAEAFASSQGRPAQEAGAINSYGFMRTDTGLAVVPSADAKQRTEDDFLQQLQWMVRNQLLPAFSGLPTPDPKQYPPPEGAKGWKWSPLHQEFRPDRDAQWYSN